MFLLSYSFIYQRLTEKIFLAMSPKFETYLSWCIKQFAINTFLRLSPEFVLGLSSSAPSKRSDLQRSKRRARRSFLASGSVIARFRDSGSSLDLTELLIRRGPPMTGLAQTARSYGYVYLTPCEVGVSRTSPHATGQRHSAPSLITWNRHPNSPLVQ